MMKKTNIIVAITPYVISDLADLRRVAEKKMRERREFIERYSSLEDHVALDKDLDFHRKRGMLEEINRTVREMEEEERELQMIHDRDNAIDWETIEPAGGKGGPVTAPEPEEEAPPAVTSDMVEAAPAEEELKPARPARVRKARRKPGTGATNPAAPAASKAAAAPKAPRAPKTPPAGKTPAAPSAKPAPPPAKE
jgi:hypothetical protein